MSWLDGIVLVAAVLYVSLALTSQDGPWGLFRRLRAAWPGGPLRCIVCTAPYVAGALLALYPWPPTRWVIWALGLAGAALMLRTYTGVAHG